MAWDDEIPAPPTRTTISEIDKPVLYLPDGRALVRQIGFRAMAQTTGTFPQLADNTKRKPKGKGKRGC